MEVSRADTLKCLMAVMHDETCLRLGGIGLRDVSGLRIFAFVTFTKACQQFVSVILGITE